MSTFSIADTGKGTSVWGLLLEGVHMETALMAHGPTHVCGSHAAGLCETTGSRVGSDQWAMYPKSSV
jgi:hypothetical protein